MGRGGGGEGTGVGQGARATGGRAFWYSPLCTAKMLLKKQAVGSVALSMYSLTLARKFQRDKIHEAWPAMGDSSCRV